MDTIPHRMPNITDAHLMQLISNHAKNLLRIKAASFSTEAQEFRDTIREKLLDSERDIIASLREIREAARARSEKVEKSNAIIYEYYKAVYADISFLLSAVNNYPPQGS
jgi:hypothetical protein